MMTPKRTAAFSEVDLTERVQRSLPNHTVELQEYVLVVTEPDNPLGPPGPSAYEARALLAAVLAIQPQTIRVTDDGMVPWSRFVLVAWRFNLVEK